MDVRDLTGATALVTGAGSGIGREIALACARRGARLVICELDETRLDEAEREKLGETGDLIETVRGIGYRFAE